MGKPEAVPVAGFVPLMDLAPFLFLRQVKPICPVLVTGMVLAAAIPVGDVLMWSHGVGSMGANAAL
jgi:hypothetical protein